MKIILFLNLLININKNIINNYIESNMSIYKYQEMKEIRYIYFYNYDYFDINNIEVYAGNKKLIFNYEFNNYYEIDLENYYPLDCLKIINNNMKFSIKFSDDNFESCFGHADVDYTKNEITIDDLIIDNPKWSKVKYSNKKISASKTIKLLE